MFCISFFDQQWPWIPARRLVFLLKERLIVYSFKTPLKNHPYFLVEEHLCLWRASCLRIQRKLYSSPQKGRIQGLCIIWAEGKKAECAPCRLCSAAHHAAGVLVLVYHKSFLLNPQALAPYHSFNLLPTHANLDSKRSLLFKNLC